MAERPQNVRPARSTERTHNSRRLQAESGSDEAQSASRSYHGSHRAERPDRPGDSLTNQRRSRVGRHHAGR